jgi:hypothetical protein
MRTAPTPLAAQRVPLDRRGDEVGAKVRDTAEHCRPVGADLITPDKGPIRMGRLLAVVIRGNERHERVDIVRVHRLGKRDGDLLGCCGVRRHQPSLAASEHERHHHSLATGVTARRGALVIPGVREAAASTVNVCADAAAAFPHDQTPRRSPWSRAPLGEGSRPAADSRSPAWHGFHALGLVTQTRAEGREGMVLLVSAALAVAIIAAIVALISAGITLYGQLRTARYQGQIARALEDQKLVQRQYADIGAFCTEQTAALTEAYLMLFEREGALDVDTHAIGRLAAKVDGLMMSPLRKYDALIDEQTRNKIYEIHNVVAQLRGNPNRDAVTNFKAFKNEFYVLIDQARVMLKPSGLLTRAGATQEQEK